MCSKNQLIRISDSLTRLYTDMAEALPKDEHKKLQAHFQELYMMNMTAWTKDYDTGKHSLSFGDKIKILTSKQPIK